MKPEHDKKDLTTVKVMPENLTLTCPADRMLMEVLMEAGLMLNAACGGAGNCGKCTVQIDNAHQTAPPTPSDEKLIAAEDLAAGFRLACRTPVQNDLSITIPEKSRITPVHMTKAGVFDLLKGRIPSTKGTAGQKMAIAVDLGTTTIGVYCCDRNTGRLVDNVAVRNPQAIFGADVISRIAAINGTPSHLKRIQTLAVRTIDWAIGQISRRHQLSADHIDSMTVVGNTTMIHLLLGADPSSIGLYPFTPAFTDRRRIAARDLGFLQVQPNTVLETPPLISGFLGCDILAAAVATQLVNAPSGTLLADLGTNGELFLKADTGIYATSCATGPAFEGGNIRHGMQAMTGAIDRVIFDAQKDLIDLSIIQGNGDAPAIATGLCGAGFMSAIAAMVQHQVVRPDGAFNPAHASQHLGQTQSQERYFCLAPARHNAKRCAVAVFQKDVRAMQLAKAAVTAGIQMLCEHAGINRPSKIVLAGAMGNFMNIADAHTIGLFSDQVPVETVGNAAGAGAILTALVPDTSVAYDHLIDQVQAINLSTDKGFQEVFVKELNFPKV